MNCFPAFIMSASFGLGRFREINPSRTILRRYRAAETAEETTFRGRPHGGRLKARLAHQRFIFLTASVSASIIAHHLIQRNKIFILLRSSMSGWCNGSICDWYSHDRGSSPLPASIKEVSLPAVSVLLPVCYASYLYLLQFLLASSPLIPLVCPVMSAI